MVIGFQIDMQRVTYERVQEDTSDLRNADVTLFSLCGQLSNKDAEMERVKKAQKQLEALDIGIRDLEAGFESLFKHLIQTRVSHTSHQPFITL